jgi:hypothetical protein
MQARSIANLLITALVLAPVAVTAQETERLFPPSVTSFADYTPGAAYLTLPQSSGEKNPTVAALLNALLLPGIGNFYAGNVGHGFRHVGLGVGGTALLVAGLAECAEFSCDDSNAGQALAVAGLIVITGNWVWSIFSGIADANAAGGSSGPGGSMASIIQPQLVPTTNRLGLQLLRFTF